MTKNIKEGSKEPQELTGVISITRRGVGYVRIDGFTEDIEISDKNTKNALHGDIVSISRAGKRNGRNQGAVEKVLERKQTKFVGEVDVKGDGLILRADNRKIHVQFELRGDDFKDIKKDTKVYVEMDAWENANVPPTAHLIEVIGEKGNHEAEMQSIVLEHGFESGFPPQVEEEAHELLKGKAINDDDRDRRDMRKITTFTIDPFDAKDFDDALSIQYLENGDVEIGVHIADVTHYVRPGTQLEKEARKRATSIYLVDRTIPMLPEILSNDVCSLVQGEDRRTFSGIFVLSSEGNVKSRWFGETIIYSDKRFTYEDAQEILDKGEGLFYKELHTMNNLAKKIRSKRVNISFEQDEIKFELDEKGVPIDVHRKIRQDTNKMIEDFMLLANEEVATHMFKHGKKVSGRDNSFIYRIHDKPNEDKIEELGIFIRALGYDFHTEGGKISAKQINVLFDQIDGKPEENLIKVATIRSMAKAIYSTQNIGHFGLSFKYYTHFTSPIRRYPDMMVHRMVKNYINKTKVSDKEVAEYQSMAIISSQREIEATKAERDSIKYKQVEYMLDKVGQEFDGTITGVVDWGLYVEDKHSKAEGLVRLGTLGGDYFTVDPKRYRAVGSKSKKSFSLGDSVRIKLTGADLNERNLDFKIIS